MREFFSTDGRLNRGRFALQYFSFFLSAVLLASGSSVYVGTTNSQSFIPGLFALVIGLLFGFLLITRTIKRFHDLGHSGWWTLATLIPLVGFTVLIYLLFWRGIVGANEYGPDPLQAAGIHNEPQSPATATPSSSPQSYNSPTKAGPVSADSAGLVTPNINEQFWATALVEFESDARRPGVWAKSFAETNGNEAAAKSAYLRYRAKELIDAHQQHLDDGRLLELGAKEKERVTKRELERAASPVGHCPNCAKIIPVDSPTCPACDAMFENAGWKVTPLRKALEVKPQFTTAATPASSSGKVIEDANRTLVGRCPNPSCKAVIALASQACSQCGAIFETGSAWRVMPISDA